MPHQGTGVLDGPGMPWAVRLETMFTKKAMNNLSVVGVLVKGAFCATLLLLSHLWFTSDGAHAWLSSLALALAGIAYIFLQIRLKPNRAVLVRRLLLAGTFIL